MMLKEGGWPPGKGEWFSLYTSMFGVMIWIGCPECGSLISVCDIKAIMECEKCNWKGEVELEGWNDGQGRMC